ncbi:MAG: hypothetical protein DDT31_01860 [Syntrophomonadaceae bacterium]|nr:hypothetical protein [Bacillota bacterium]
MRMPGIKVRKIKPTTCLKTGASKPRAAKPVSTKLAKRMASATYRHFLIRQLLSITLNI